jgi:hypothetical protein
MWEEEIFTLLHWMDPGILYLKWGMQFGNTAFVNKFQYEYRKVQIFGYCNFTKIKHDNTYSLNSELWVL